MIEEHKGSGEWIRESQCSSGEWTEFLKTAGWINLRSFLEERLENARQVLETAKDVDAIRDAQVSCEELRAILEYPITSIEQSKQEEELIKEEKLMEEEDNE